MKVRIAARKSDLARLQAYTVGRALKNKLPTLEVEYHFSASLGDKNLTDPLWKMPEKGVFTQDLTHSLINNNCDLVVHSWKDLPVEENPQTAIVATLPREDARDLLLVRPEAFGKNSLTVLSSSPRREYNNGPFIRSVLPWTSDLNFVSVRGNVPTRIEKLLTGNGDALLVAKAAMDRLLESEEAEFASVRDKLRSALQGLFWMVLPLSQCPTAAAQGALAIEILKSRKDLLPLFKEIHCEKTFQAVLKEREVLKSYGGGCHQKIGISIFAHRHGTVFSLRGKTDAGLELEKFELQTKDTSTVERDVEFFPANMQQNQLFTSDPLPVERSKLQNRDLFVAKFPAWPSDYKPSRTQVVWAAGVRTWRKLAEAGVWVNGCLDGLGEGTEPHVEILSGRESNFIKLTHKDAANEKSLLEGLRDTEAWVSESLGTYRLTPIQNFPDLRGVQYFYWSSFSHFKAAHDRYAEISEAQHACGPGNTYDLISNALGKTDNVRVFLSQKSWLEWLRNYKSKRE